MSDVARPTLALPLYRPNLDVSFKGWLGGSIYLQNLARVLSDLPAPERPRIIVLTDGAMDTPIVRSLYGKAAVEGVFRPDGAPLSLKPVLFSRLVGPGLQPDRPAIQRLFGEVTAVFPVFRTMLNCPRGLHWIPDFQHKHLPAMFDAAELARRDEDFDAMTHGRDFLLLSSQSAKRDLERFYPGATANVYVWPFTSSLDVSLLPADDPRPRLGLPEKFLFAPNQFWKHKDHLTLFRAIKLLSERGLAVTVACTGTGVDFRHPAYFDELQEFVRAAELNDRIKFLGVVPTETLTQLFRFAAGIVQPSLFEGWSTVVEDAKALGRPIILSDLPVHLEQGEGVGNFTFFSQGNPDALAERIALTWPKLDPGPDRVGEAKAGALRQTRDVESARAFMSIIHDIDTKAWTRERARL